MNTKQSFIGAHARTRRNVQARDKHPSATQTVAAPHITPAPIAPAAPDRHAAANEPAVAKDAVAKDLVQPIETVIDPSASVSDAVASALHVWVDQPQGQILRFDPPVVTQPETHPVETIPFQNPVQEIPQQLTSERQPMPAEVAPAVSEVEESAKIAPPAAPSPTVTPTMEAPQRQPARPTRLTPKPRWEGAAWEVDTFEIPHNVTDLFFDETFFRSIAEHMGRSVHEGLRSVLVTSLAAGEGRSTVAIGTAIAAAAAGIRVAPVDVDLETPSQADQLRLEIESDWVDAIRRGESLENAAILSIEDGVTLLPLSTNRTSPVTPTEIEQLLERLGGCFDLLMFDGSRVHSPTTQRIASAVDSSLIVRDARSTSRPDVALAANRLRQLGVQGIGVVDNFCG